MSKPYKNASLRRKSVINDGRMIGYSSKEELHDHYIVPNDYIWKDCILHERKSAETWTRTWNSFPELIHAKPAPVKVRDDRITDPKCILYRRSSEMVGNYLRRPAFPLGENIINGKIHHYPPKIRFTAEQYGHYRIRKYLKDNSLTLSPKYPVSRFIRHDVYPLLC